MAAELEILLSALVGLSTGMLVNYLADVLPYWRRPVYPRCLNCQARFPIVNYLFWPRRCLECDKRRGWRTWLVEFCLALAAAWIFRFPLEELNDWISLLLLGYLTLVIVIDVEHRLILHPVSLVGAIFGLVVGFRLHGLPATLIGGAAGFGVMLVLYLLGEWLMGWLSRLRGRKLAEEALGFGDVVLGGVIGLILGWPGVLAGLLLAILLGGIISLVYLVVMVVTRRYRFDLALPYGPFLAGSVIILLYVF